MQQPLMLKTSQNSLSCKIIVRPRILQLKNNMQLNDPYFITNCCSIESSPNNKDKSTVQDSNQNTRRPSIQKMKLYDSAQFTKTKLPNQIQRYDEEGKDFYHIKTTEYKNYKYQKYDLKQTQFNFLQDVKMMQPVVKNSKWRNYSNYQQRVSLSALKTEFLIQQTLSDYLVEDCAIPRLSTVNESKTKQRNQIAQLLKKKILSSQGQSDLKSNIYDLKSQKITRFFTNFSILQHEQSHQFKKRLAMKKCISLPHLQQKSNLDKLLYKKEQSSMIKG